MLVIHQFVSILIGICVDMGDFGPVIRDFYVGLVELIVPLIPRSTIFKITKRMKRAEKILECDDRM